MQLYLVRHGIALDVGQQGIQRDADRCLSPEGIEKTTEVARGLAALGIHVDHIGTSPLIRARDTARILAEWVGRDAPMEECDFLEPSGSTTDFVQWLKRIPADSVLAVGHMPDVARMASELLSGHANMEIEFKKAAVCCIAFDKVLTVGTGRLEWLMQPRHLRALARTTK